MNRFACGLAASLVMGTSALAQPTELSNPQMDQVSAGFLEIDTSNTSYVVVSILFKPGMFDSTLDTIDCPGCYLRIVTQTISVGARFGP